MNQILEKNENTKMNDLFYILQEQKSTQFDEGSEKKNQFKLPLLWTSWIVMLLKFYIFCKKEKKSITLPSKISEKTKYLFEIIQKERHFEYMIDEINKNPTLFDIKCFFPHLNIEIFLSKFEKQKIDVKFLTLIFNCLYVFKLKYLPKGSHECYYKNFVFFFKTISKIQEFPLPIKKNGIPEKMDNFLLPETVGLDNNWLERNINYFGFEKQYNSNIYKSKLQNKINIVKTGMKSKTIQFSTYFLKILFFLSICIPWGDPIIYENIENRIFVYYFCQIFFVYIAGVLVNGRRNLYTTPVNLLSSKLKFYIEKQPTEKSEQLYTIWNDDKICGPETISFLEFCKQKILKINPEKSFLPDFELNPNRENLNTNKDCGILRSTCYNDTVLKKIDKGRNSTNVTQENHLACGHTHGNWKQSIQSPLFCSNGIPFPCTLCSSVRVGSFLALDIEKNFDGNIDSFHKFLDQNNCHQNSDKDLSYFLHMNLQGKICPKIIRTNQSGQMYLPFRHSNGEISFKMSDPSEFILKFLKNGSLNLQDKEKKIWNIFGEKFLEFPEFTKKWFNTLDPIFWVKKILKENEPKNFTFGIYSFRAISTFLCNLYQIPKHISKSIFGWVSKGDTQEKNYGHDDALRSESLNQISFQNCIYTYLLNSHSFDFFTNWTDMKKDTEFISNQKIFHPQQKLH